MASTESIFVYLGDYLGLNVISPPEFMQAVAEGNDPPAPSVAAFEDQITHKQAKVLVYNQQTSTAVTTNLRKLAASHGIPVVGVTETIQPPTRSFQQWFGAELVDLENALNAGAKPAARPVGPRRRSAILIAMAQPAASAPTARPSTVRPRHRGPRARRRVDPWPM